MSKPLVRNALVVGGGLSGITAAIALRRLGIAVDLVEMDPSWQPPSGLVQLCPDAIRILQSLGVHDACMDAAWRSPGIDTVALPRALLARVLADAAFVAGAQVRLGTTFRLLRQACDGVEVEFTDNQAARYDLLVGADGARSRVRELVLRGAPLPVPAGLAAWHAQLDRPEGLAQPAGWRHEDIEIDLYPTSPDGAHLCVRQPHANGPVPAEQVLGRMGDLLAGFPEPAVRALEARLHQGAHATHLPLESVDMAPPWHSGRVVLVGDAVRGTLERFGVHGSRGMQDAVLLAQELDAGESVDAALASYARRRWQMDRQTGINGN